MKPRRIRTPLTSRTRCPWILSLAATRARRSQDRRGSNVTPARKATRHLTDFPNTRSFTVLATWNVSSRVSTVKRRTRLWGRWRCTYEPTPFPVNVNCVVRRSPVLGYSRVTWEPIRGEKPFACPHCGRAFADRSNLRAHLQTHTDIKKYNCKSCSKTFSRMSLLLKHQEGSCLGLVRWDPLIYSWIVIHKLLTKYRWDQVIIMFNSNNDCMLNTPVLLCWISLINMQLQLFIQLCL